MRPVAPSPPFFSSTRKVPGAPGISNRPTGQVNLLRESDSKAGLKSTPVGMAARAGVGADRSRAKTARIRDMRMDGLLVPPNYTLLERRIRAGTPASGGSPRLDDLTLRFSFVILQVPF
jgi:hypothetical protein